MESFGILQLPDEILIEIFMSIDVVTCIRRISFVCWRFRRLVDEADGFWRLKTINRFSKTHDLEKLHDEKKKECNQSEVVWKKLFFSIARQNDDFFMEAVFNDYKRYFEMGEEKCNEIYSMFEDFKNCCFSANCPDEEVIPKHGGDWDIRILCFPKKSPTRIKQKNPRKSKKKKVEPVNNISVSDSISNEFKVEWNKINNSFKGKKQTKSSKKRKRKKMKKLVQNFETKYSLESENGLSFDTKTGKCFREERKIIKTSPKKENSSTLSDDTKIDISNSEDFADFLGKCFIQSKTPHWNSSYDGKEKEFSENWEDHFKKIDCERIKKENLTWDYLLSFCAENLEPSRVLSRFPSRYHRDVINAFWVQKWEGNYMWLCAEGKFAYYAFSHGTS